MWISILIVFVAVIASVYFSQPEARLSVSVDTRDSDQVGSDEDK